MTENKERTLVSSLKEAKSHWRKILRSIYKLRLAGLKKRDLQFHIKISDEKIEITFSPAMTNLISKLEINERGVIPVGIMKVLKRHAKETKVNLEPVLQFYKPEIFVSQNNSIIISRNTALDCPEGPFSLISTYLEILKVFLDLKYKDERIAIKNMTEKFKKRHKKGLIKFKRSAKGMKINMVISEKHTDPQNKKYRKVEIFYPANGESIRKRQKDIFCFI